jgi:hypothetical protein
LDSSFLHFIITQPSFLSQSPMVLRNSVKFSSPPFYGFTPLESRAIYGGNIRRKCSFIIKSGVKAPSFLTGFTFLSSFYAKSSLPWNDKEQICHKRSKPISKLI